MPGFGPKAESESLPNPAAPAVPLFSAKDLITVILSASALIVSVSGFYFGNLKVDNNLQMRVVDVDVQPMLSQRPTNNPNPESFIIAHTAFVNAGNRPALLMRVDYTVGPTGGHWVFGNEIETSAKLLPLVIQPHEIRLIDLGIPLNNLVQTFATGAPVTDPNDPGPVAEFNCSFEVTSLDSSGVSHDKATVPVIMARVSKTRWLSAGGLNKGAVTYLFK